MAVLLARDLLLLPDFGDDLFKLVNHVVVGGTASRGRRGGFQWVSQVTGPVFSREY
jgi:hypothetical protein